MGRGFVGWILGDDVRDDSAGDVGESEVASGVAEGEAFVIDAEEVKNGGVEVVGVDPVAAGHDAVFVGFAKDVAAFDAAAGHPGGEAEVMVFAPFVIGLLVERGSAELGGPNDEGAFEHAALFEVGEESGNGAVDVFGEAFVIHHVAVGIPVCAGADIDEFEEADAAFGESSSDEALPAESCGGTAREAVEGEGCVGF